MDDGTVVLALVVLVGLGAAVPGLASGRPANEPPLADAGLDQTASVGETVRLDATGSRDPDGSVAAYEWRIETPDGSVTTPACRTCGTTTFRPLSTGRYNVTVTVTDDSGATRSDTLYLTVDPGQGPEVTVSGPTGPTVGWDATYTADVTAGDVGLRNLTWRLDGSSVGSRSLSGDSATVDLTRSFNTRDSHTLSATVTDTAGQTSTANLTIGPTFAVGSGGSGGGSRGDGDQPDGFYLNGGGGSGTWVPTNDDGGPVAASSEAGAVDRAQTIVGDAPGADAGIDSGNQGDSESSDTSPENQF